MPLWFHDNAGGHKLLQDDPPTLTRPAAYKLGLDLGAVDDYTALSVIEVSGSRAAGEVHYRVSHLERWRGVSYPRLVQEVAAILEAMPPGNRHELLVDATGVGLPVLQLLQRAGLSPIGITITAGDSTGTNAAGLTVPKSALVSALQVVVQTQRLKVSPKLPAARTLATEMQEFQRRQNAVTGRNMYASWREGSHDDLVLSVCMAIWHAEAISAVAFY